MFKRKLLVTLNNNNFTLSNESKLGVKSHNEC